MKPEQMPMPRPAPRRTEMPTCQAPSQAPGTWAGLFSGQIRAPAILMLLVLLLVTAGCTAPVKVEWTTETEMNTAGFNLYRSTSPEGPFDFKVNDQLIPASPDPLTGGKYSYVDSTARPGIVYYYQLQEVERSGAINKYGPITVRAVGFDWRLGGVLGALALVVLILWVRGGRAKE